MSIVEREVDFETPRRSLFSIGRLLIVLQIYLGIAAGIALETNELFAPPVLIFFQLDYGVEISLLVLAVCTWELLIYRTTAAIVTFITAVVIACTPLWVWIWMTLTR